MGGPKPIESTGFAARLKALREAKGMSQQQLADAAGLNVGGVTKIEQGQREPGWSTVLKLAAALDVDCTAFTAAEEPAPKKGGKKK
jgi:transcriptional regulator with XRE-family HTH domain